MGRSFEIRVDTSLYHTEPGIPLARLVTFFAVVPLVVDFFPPVVAPSVAPRLIEGARCIVGRSFARADFFWAAVEPRRAVLVAVDAALAVGGFLCVTLFVDVPSCRGFSSLERCTATTSL